MISFHLEVDETHEKMELTRCTNANFPEKKYKKQIKYETAARDASSWKVVWNGDASEMRFINGAVNVIAPKTLGSGMMTTLLVFTLVVSLTRQILAVTGE